MRDGRAARGGGGGGGGRIYEGRTRWENAWWEGLVKEGWEYETPSEEAGSVPVPRRMVGSVQVQERGGRVRLRRREAVEKARET